MGCIIHEYHELMGKVQIVILDHPDPVVCITCTPSSINFVISLLNPTEVVKLKKG